MKALVTGSGGLIGSTVTEFLIEQGMFVVGVDNDMRGKMLGKRASVDQTIASLVGSHPKQYRHYRGDVRSIGLMNTIIKREGPLTLVVHAAGQPSHEYSADHPMEDFCINAQATVGLLEAIRQAGTHTTFVYLSTNKVYGDRVNRLPFKKVDNRWDLPEDHPLYGGIGEKIGIDIALHSPFGAAKAGADLMVQEYGRYYGIPTACFRCGCLTGSSQKGVAAHGFLSHLVRCIKDDRPYTIFGYEGRQVRDNLHAKDVASAIWAFYSMPTIAAVYNLGGGRENSCSVLEVIELVGGMKECGRPFTAEYSSTPRKGDHIWWITDTQRFRTNYPDWRVAWSLKDILKDLIWD